MRKIIIGGLCCLALISPVTLVKAIDNPIKTLDNKLHSSVLKKSRKQHRKNI